MHKVLALAFLSPMLLVGAAEPAAAPADAAQASYRPCRPGPGDDRCIQLYESGVRAAYARWQSTRPAGEDRSELAAGEDRTELAMGGPVEPPAPRLGYGRRDPRCADESQAGATASETALPPDRPEGETRGM